jgi:addiction module HigA family antidote
MNNKQTNQYYPDYLVTPGDVLEDHLVVIGMSQAELATRTGLAKKTINEIIKGKSSITAETAVKLERVLGRPSRFWMNLESNYQEDRVRLEQKSHMTSNLEWLNRFPIRAMVKYEWLPSYKDKIAQLEALLSFLGVASPAEGETVRQKLCVAYRQSDRHEICDEAVFAWLRKGELEARKIESAPYDEQSFKEILVQVRKLTQEEDPQVFVPELTKLCATVGVAVVFVPELPRIRTCGAVRWINSKPVIQLSLRYKTNDHLWFSFFHEVGHILKHGRKILFLEVLKESGSIYEKEADEFARSYLIAPSDLHVFLSQGNFTQRKVQDFARRIGIAPGVVIGRLQHDRYIPYSKGNQLKISYTWN